MSEYWEDQKKQPDFKTWMEELRGSILCDCGHGCRDWIANNGAKSYKIIEALLSEKGASTEDLDKIVQKHTTEVGKEVWDDRMKEKP